MPLFLLSSRSPASRMAYAALALSLSLFATVAPAPVAAQGLPDFTELVEKVGPAVVNIRTTERGRTARGGSGNDSRTKRWRSCSAASSAFPPGQNRPNPRAPQQPDGEPQQRGVGSGFILNADGYVMTNAHVVEGADEVIVTLADKREFKAKTIGADKRSDVALVKIEASGLPTVRHRRRLEAQGRRVGDRDRLAVRPREHGHRGHRQRQVARHRRPSAPDPDRRRHQSRQLRRPADQHARRSRRHQLADLQPLGRLHGHLVRDPDRRGDARVGAAARRRPRHPRPDRRRHRPPDARGRRVDRPRQADRRARAVGRSRRSGREGGRRARRRDHARSTAARSKRRSSCRASSAASSRGPRRRCRSSVAAATAI